MDIDIVTVRKADNNAYQRGIARAKKYFAAMNEKETVAFLEVMLETKEDMIEHQKNYIHALKAELAKLREEAPESQRVTDGLAAEGMLFNGGITHLNPGDTVILKHAVRCAREALESMEEAFAKAGINVIDMACGTEIAGVVEHGT